jgi:hypothetical protein
LLLVEVGQPIPDDMAQSTAYLIANDSTADGLTDDEPNAGTRGLDGRRDMDDHGRASGAQPGSQYVGELWAAA